jgi:serine protease Do
VQERLIEKGRLDRGYLDVGVADLDEQLVRQLHGMDINSLEELLADLGMERAEGAFVSGAPPGGPGAKAGLEVGDVILEYGVKGSKLQTVRTSEDLVFLVADTPPGTAVTVTVLRDRQTKSIDATLGARP